MDRHGSQVMVLLMRNPPTPPRAREGTSEKTLPSARGKK